MLRMAAQHAHGTPEGLSLLQQRMGRGMRCMRNQHPVEMVDAQTLGLWRGQVRPSAYAAGAQVTP
jgi:hypothetical protein